MTTYTAAEKKGLTAAMELLALQAALQGNNVVEKIIRDVLRNIDADIYDVETLDILIQFLASGRGSSCDSVEFTQLHRKTVRMFLERNSCPPAPPEP